MTGYLAGKAALGRKEAEMGYPRTKEDLELGIQSHANVTHSNKVMFEAVLLHLVAAVREGNEERRVRLMTALQQTYDFAADGQHSLFRQILEKKFAENPPPEQG